MGTDIHTTVEVRRKVEVEPGRYANAWVWAGKVFDSSYDWDYLPATREVLEKLDNDQLLDSLDFYVTDVKYGKLCELISDEIVEIFKRWDEVSVLIRDAVEIKRNEISSRPEGWDYSIVKEYELGLKAIRSEDFKDAFTKKQRNELVSAAVKYFADDENDYSDRTPIRISLRKDDPPFKTHEPFSPRNYDLFAALAGVRNGRGFAGVYTGEPIVPIAEPRGIPEDADEDTLKCLSNEHTPSWLTLSELTSYNWDQGKRSGGIVSGEDYLLLKKINPDNLYPWSDAAQEKSPNMSVSGDIAGQGIRVFESGTAYETWLGVGSPWVPSWNDRFDHETGLKPEINAFVRIDWFVPLRESISDEFFAGLEAMKELIPPGGTKGDVRLVFDFDS